MGDLAAVLADGVSALREGDPAVAAELIGQVAQDPDFASSDELADLRLRVLTLHAQALLESGQASQARRPLLAARELQVKLGIEEAAQAIHELEERIGAAVSERFAAQARARTLRALAKKDVDAILDEVPRERHPAMLVERAAAALEVDRPDEAVQIAQRALELATARADLRHQVLALLVLARAQPERAPARLEEARRRADEGDAFDLLAFVVQAAREADVTLQNKAAHAQDIP